MLPGSFSFFFSPTLFPQIPPVHSYIFYLWVLLAVACGMLSQRGLMSGAMSAPRIRTGETLGRQSGAHELNHSAMGPAPRGSFSKVMKAVKLQLKEAQE